MQKNCIIGGDVGITAIGGDGKSGFGGYIFRDGARPLYGGSSSTSILAKIAGNSSDAHYVTNIRAVTPATSVTEVTTNPSAPQSVSFTLTNAPDFGDTAKWKVYNSAVEDTVPTDVTIARTGNTLTLAHTSNLPPSDYYVSVLTPGKAESVRLKLTVSEAVAEVTPQGGKTTQYASFASAWEAALNADTATVVLLKGVDTTNHSAWPITVPKNKTITLDLNGCNIDRGLTIAQDGGNVITVNGSLTLMDSGSSGAIKGGYNKGFGGGVYSDGTFTMSGGVIESNTANTGGGVSAVGAGRFTMEGNATISANTASSSNSGGMLVSTSSFSMSGDAAVIDNIGGGLSVADSTIALSGAVNISGNTMNGDACNLTLWDDQILSVGSGGLNGANIGVTTESQPTRDAAVKITGENSVDYSAYFHCDNTSCVVASIGPDDAQVLTLGLPAGEVTLNHNDGSGASDRFIPMQGAAIPNGVTMPTRANYRFAGYFTGESDGDMVIDAFGAYVPSVSEYTENGKWIKDAAATLCAQWTANACTITLDKNGGIADGSAAATYDSPTIDSITHVIRTNYTLTGYFSQDIGGDMVIDAFGAYKADAGGFTDSDGKWIYKAATATLYAQWIYSPPPPPPDPDPDPVVIYDENGNVRFLCNDLREALDKVEKGQTIVINADQTYPGELTIPDGVTVYIRGGTLTCATLIISEGATLIIGEGELVEVSPAFDKDASKVSRFERLTIKGTLINRGSLTLIGAAVEGNGMLEFEAGSVTLKGHSRLGKVTMAKGLTITIDESFVKDIVTGAIYLPADCCEIGYKVVTFAGDKNPANFWLGDDEYSDWYIDKQGCLARDESEPSEIIPEYLVVGKNTKTNTAFLLPWGYNGAVTWSSGDVTILKIVKNGKKRLFRGVEAGETTLCATFADDETRIIPVRVVAKKEAVASVGGPDAVKLNRGEVKQLATKIKPAGAVDRKLFWHSSDEKIATVENGLITAVGTGTCRVVAVSTSGKRMVVKVTVTKKAAIEEVTLTPVEVTLKKGETYTLTAAVAPADADQTLKWSSDKPKTASVKKGVVTAKKAGTAVITCKFANGEKLTCKVMVAQ